MKINKITIKNYKGIKDLEIDLNGKNTVFFGENGTGKTSILNAITTLYYPIINKIALKKNKPVNILEEDITFGESKTNLELDLNINQKSKIFWLSKERKNSKNKSIDNNSLDQISEILKYQLADSSKEMPIFINYGVHRTVFKVPLRIKIKHDSFSTVVAFENCLNPITDFRTFFEWYRNQEDIENELVRENKDYVDIPLNSVKNAIYTFLPEISNLKIRRKPRLQMIVTKNKTTLQIQQLSDGEKCLLALVGDIARRLSIANTTSKNPLLCSGVVLIDEIELHLHPKWQRYIIPNLNKTFPNIQFIITTHSPQVLGEVSDSNIFRFARENEKLTVEKINSSFGWDSNFILEHYMNTSKENKEIKDLIEKLYTLIDEEYYSEAKELQKSLASKLAFNTIHPDLVNSSILIRRGELKNDIHKKKRSTK